MSELTLEEIDAKIEEYLNLRKDLAKNQGVPTVQSLFAPLFEYPGVESAEWHQYIPGFNDGDPCVFTINNDLTFNGKQEEEEFDQYELEEWGISKSPLGVFTTWDMSYRPNDFYAKNWSDELIASFKNEVQNVERWLGNHDEFLEDVFGSNAQIIVTKDRVISDYYDCGF